MDTQTQEKTRLESDLHEALAFNQFELVYQPKVDLKSGDMHGAEALIRWHHPARGLIMPADFMPLAEETGLIGRWVIREACRQAKAWQNDGLAPVRVAVNLSASQFRHDQLLQTIDEALADSGLEPRYLENDAQQARGVSSSV